MNLQRKFNSFYVNWLPFFLANYNADEDEYLTKRGKGFNDLHIDVNDRPPICEQPGRQENGIR